MAPWTPLRQPRTSSSRRPTARCRWAPRARCGPGARPTRPRPRRSPRRCACGSCGSTLHEPRTNKEIAEALGLNPASVLHHVRTLVDTGFLIEQPVRRGPRGSRERPYLASGKTWYLDIGDAGRAGEQDLLLRDLPRGGQRPAARPARQRPARVPAQDGGPRAAAGAVPGPPPGGRRAAERPRGRAVEHLPRRSTRRSRLPVIRRGVRSRHERSHHLDRGLGPRQPSPPCWASRRRRSATRSATS